MKQPRQPKPEKPVKLAAPKAAGPSLGFEVGPLHDYLGHFKAEGYLRAGHNTDLLQPVAGTLSNGGVARNNQSFADRFRNDPDFRRRAIDSLERTRAARVTGRPQVLSALPGGEQVNVVGPGGKVKTQAIDQLGVGLARRAIKAGGDIGAAVAAERPVLAAQVSKRQAIEEARRTGGDVAAARKAGNAAIAAARNDPNSARMERRAARAARLEARAQKLLKG